MVALSGNELVVAHDVDQVPDSDVAETARPVGDFAADDEPALRALLSVISLRRSVAVWLTPTGCRGIKVYRGRRADIDFVLIDVRRFGVEERNPANRLYFVDGDVAPSSVLPPQQAVERVTYRPCRLGEVREFLQQVLHNSGIEFAAD